MKIKRFAVELPLYLAVVANLFIGLISGYSVATAIAQNTPNLAAGTLTVLDTPSSSNSYGEVEELASSEGLTVARKEFRTAAGSTVVSVTYPQSATETEPRTYRYGGVVFQAERTKTALRDIGIWVVHGDKTALLSFNDSLQINGFATELSLLSSGNTVQIIQSDLGLLAANFTSNVMLFLCSLIVANRYLKTSSVWELLGVSPLRSFSNKQKTIALTIALFTLIIAAGFVTFSFLASGSKNYGSVILPLDLIALFCLVGSAILTLLVTAAGFGLVLSRKISLRDRLKGERPYRLLKILTAVTIGVSLLNSFTLLEVTSKATKSLTATAASQEIWVGHDSARMLTVPYLDEEKLVKHFHSVHQLVSNLDQYGVTALFSELDSQCLSDGRECLWVSPSYLEKSGAELPRQASPSKVTAFYNSGAGDSPEQLETVIRERLTQEQELLTNEAPAAGGSTEEQQLELIDSGKTGTLPIYNAAFGTQNTVEDAVLIVMPLSTISGNNLLSYITTGNVSFFGDEEQLQRAITDYGLTELELEIVSPQNEAASIIVETAERLSKITLQSAIAVITMLAATVFFCLLNTAQQRKILTVKSVLGYSPIQRNRAVWLQLTALALLAFAAYFVTNLSASPEANYRNLGLVAVISALTLVTALVSDRASYSLKQNLGG